MFEFLQFTVSGIKAGEFLQGQITADIKKLSVQPQLTSICDLKGRVQFGFFIQQQTEESFILTIESSLAEELQAHLKKYGVFSRVVLSELTAVKPYLIDQQFVFSAEPLQHPVTAEYFIRHGVTIICKQTSQLFQPQELRLHQLNGVHYDKGCYIGQEIIARLYFKASPKAFLHLISGQGNVPNLGDNKEQFQQMSIVNACATETGFLALVVARPDVLANSDVQILDLPVALQQPIAREK